MINSEVLGMITEVRKITNYYARFLQKVIENVVTGKRLKIND